MGVQRGEGGGGVGWGAGVGWDGVGMEARGWLAEGVFTSKWAGKAAARPFNNIYSFHNYTFQLLLRHVPQPFGRHCDPPNTSTAACFRAASPTREEVRFLHLPAFQSPPSFLYKFHDVFSHGVLHHPTTHFSSHTRNPPHPPLNTSASFHHTLQQQHSPPIHPTHL